MLASTSSMGGFALQQLQNRSIGNVLVKTVQLSMQLPGAIINGIAQIK